MHGLKHVFIDPAVAMSADVLEAAEATAPDVVVSNEACLPAAFAQDRLRRP